MTASPMPDGDGQPLHADFGQMEAAFRLVADNISAVFRDMQASLRTLLVSLGFIKDIAYPALLPGQLKHAFKPDFDLACTVHGCTRQPEQH